MGSRSTEAARCTKVSVAGAEQVQQLSQQPFRCAKRPQVEGASSCVVTKLRRIMSYVLRLCTPRKVSCRRVKC